MLGKKKRCSGCGETRLIKQFSKNRYNQDGYQYQCKTCRKKLDQSDKGKKTKKKYQQSQKGTEVKRRYRLSDKGKRSQRRANTKHKGTEKRKQSNERYEQTEKARQNKRKRKAIRCTKKSQAGGSYTTTEWYNLCEFYDFCCLKCQGQFPFGKLTFDHVKPISKGGTSFIFNAQPLCFSCNASKGNREIDYRKTLPDWINRSGPVWIQDALF